MQEDKPIDRLKIKSSPSPLPRYYRWVFFLLPRYYRDVCRSCYWSVL